MISLSQLFISNAYAEGAAPVAQDGSMMQFLPLVALLAVFYFLILRPQQKRAKELKTMVEALQKGDEVVTVGGILGKITKVGEDNVGVEIADNVVVQVQKPAIQNVLPKGTIKSL
ncbi:MAG: preprotein translocase subunit YajC [Sideroxyarcus sp.]